MGLSAYFIQFEAMNKRLHGEPSVEARNGKFVDLERGMKQLERKLKEGSALDTGQRGSNKVSAMAQQLAKKTLPQSNDQEQKVQQQPSKPNQARPVLNLPPQGGSEACHFCQKRVYLMERMSAEGKYFHRGCFRCEYCSTALRLGGYSFVRDDVLGGVFFCTTHVTMVYYMRAKYLRSKTGPVAPDAADAPVPPPRAVRDAKRQELHK